MLIIAAVSFGGGLLALLLLRRDGGPAPAPERPHIVLVPLGERAERAAGAILAGLRREGVAADMAYRGNLKKRLSKANAAGAAYALILGDDELDSGEVQLKDLASGEQRKVSLDLIGQAIAR